MDANRQILCQLNRGLKFRVCLYCVFKNLDLFLCVNVENNFKKIKKIYFNVFLSKIHFKVLLQSQSGVLSHRHHYLMIDDSVIYRGQSN